MPTTIQTITPEQIQRLREEAGAAGDSDMAAICTVALTGDTTELEPEDGERLGVQTREDAIRKCVAAISAAEAIGNSVPAHGATSTTPAAGGEIAGYEIREGDAGSEDALRVTVGAEDATEALAAIEAALPAGWSAALAGTGNTDGDGQSTEDVILTAPERKPTAFDGYLAEQMKKPGFRAEYEAERARLAKK